MNSAGPRCDAKQKRKTLEEENEQMFKTQFRNEAHRPYDGSNYASCMLHARICGGEKNTDQHRELSAPDLFGGFSIHGQRLDVGNHASNPQHQSFCNRMYGFQSDGNRLFLH